MELAAPRRLGQRGGPFSETAAMMTADRDRRMPGKTEFVVLIAALMAANALAIDAMLPALPAIGETLGVTDGQSPPAGDHLLSARLRRGAAFLRAVRRPVRPQDVAGRLHGLLRLVRRAGGAGGEHEPAARRPLHAGRGGGRHAGAGRGDRPRPFPRLGHGAGDVAGDDRLHVRAGAGADASARAYC